MRYYVPCSFLLNVQICICLCKKVQVNDGWLWIFLAFLYCVYCMCIAFLLAGRVTLPPSPQQRSVSFPLAQRRRFAWRGKHPSEILLVLPFAKRAKGLCVENKPHGQLYLSKTFIARRVGRELNRPNLACNPSCLLTVVVSAGHSNSGGQHTCGGQFYYCADFFFIVGQSY